MTNFRLLTVSLVFCVLAFNSVYAKDAQQSSVASPNEVVHIGPGDLVDIVVFDTAELSGQFRIDENGDASFPLIGEVRLSGLTTRQAEHVLRERLITGEYVNDPQVTLFISDYASQGISILGEVTKPGIYPMLGAKRLFDIISLASGLTPTAGTAVAISHRGTPQQTQTLVFRENTVEIASANIELLPGDTVIVQRAGIVYVIGDVGKPGGFIMDREKMTVLEAMALAQGATKTASLNNAKLLHRTATGLQQTILPLNSILKAKAPDPMMQAGDIVYVPSSAPKTAMQSGLQGILSSAVGAAIYTVSR